MPETLKTIASFADLFSPFERTNALGQKPQGVMQYMPQQKPVSNSFLRQRYPQTYGFLGGLMGTAPDEFEGSVLDPLSAQVRKGAEYGFPLGVALEVSPLALASGKPLGQVARVGMRNMAQPTTLNRQFGGVMMGEKAQAPVDPLGFYSAVEEAAMNMPRKSGQGQALLNDIMKGANVKADEVKWMGLDDYLAGKPNVTKQEVQDYIAANKVDLQEVTLGANKANQEKLLSINDIRVEPEGDSGRWFIESPTNNVLARAGSEQEAKEFGVRYFNSQIAERNRIALKEADNTKFGSYTLPGGENYREILLTMPSKTSKDGLPAGYSLVDEGGGRWSFDGPSVASRVYKSRDEAIAAALRDAGEERINGVGIVGEYKSSHWDEPNVLAHMRVNDRIDADGKKMLLIEEVQSDWHQAGRTKGYDTPERKLAQQKQLDDIVNERQRLLDEQKRIEDLAKPYTEQGKDAPANLIDQWNIVSNRLNALQTQQNRLGRNFGSTGVPDAPFKDTWYQLALKRAIKHAADNGYDRVGLTTGKRQAERYDLSKQVDHIDYRSSADGTFELGIADINGDAVNLPKTRYTAEELPSIVGKEIAEKMIKGEGQSGGGRMTLRGLDLQVGGEGMKKYYDEIYPKFLDKYGKKWGAKVGETSISTERSRDASGIPSMYPQQEPIRYIDITPEMKASVSKGQPLFTAAPAIPAMSFGDLFNEPSDSQKELSFSDLFKAK